MKIQEANKIIAEYMGTYIIRDAEYCFGGVTKSKQLSVVYSKSLDALVPVFEKLEINGYAGTTEMYNKKDGYLEFTIYHTVFCDKENNFKSLEFTAQAKTIQEAACIATAKCIRGIGE